MKLRKLIPAAVAVLLALVLSVGLFVHGVPNALAVDQELPLKDWILVESGYVHGLDHAIYPYSCVLMIQPNFPALCSDNTFVHADNIYAYTVIDNKSMNEVPGVLGGYVALEVYMYIPELDIYVTKTMASGDFSEKNLSDYAGGCDVAVFTEEGGQVYLGEAVRVTAKYYLMDQEIATISWQAES